LLLVEGRCIVEISPDGKFSVPPARSCKKKTGPVESNLIANEIKPKSGEKRMMPTIALTRLSARRNAISSRDFLKSVEKIRKLGVKFSMPVFRKYSCTLIPSSTTIRGALATTSGGMAPTLPERDNNPIGTELLDNLLKPIQRSSERATVSGKVKTAGTVVNESRDHIARGEEL
jgi:hypothetical protein